MRRMVRCLVVLLALVAFVGATVAVAQGQEWWVAKGKDGKLAIVDKKPTDAASIVKGPFKTKEEAEKALKAASGGGPAQPPESGC